MMTQRQVYQLMRQIEMYLPLGKWQVRGLAWLVTGILLSEQSVLSKIAEKLWLAGRATSVERRLQRWLANERVNMSRCTVAWVSWVMGSMLDVREIVLLVDLTKLSNRLDVLMIGLAYRKRCIPLAWRCMPGQQPWNISQVQAIKEMLQEIAAGLPAGCVPIVQADRGIGNSPSLVQAVQDMNWIYLFRVAGTVYFRNDTIEEAALETLIQRGQTRHYTGEVFKNAGWISAEVHLLWKSTMREPWCLITNGKALSGRLYSWRMWQEESFRDLKSGGWQWQRSQVRHPDHASRLILALALAYALILSQGTFAIREGREYLRTLSTGRQRRYSVFRLGLRAFNDLRRQEQPLCMGLFLRPNLTNSLKLS